MKVIMLRRKVHIFHLAAFAVLCSPVFACAGFEAALAAFQNSNHPKALAEAKLAVATGDARACYLLGIMYQNGMGVDRNPTEATDWYEKAARSGVAGAYAKLAQIYARGEGAPRNHEKALYFARKSSQAGDPEGMFFVHALLKGGVLSYLDANGKPDHAKYQRLAKRPLSERTLDIEAHDNLLRATEQGYSPAIFMLAVEFGGTIGDSNRERMLQLADKIPQHTLAALKNYEKIARQMNTLGQSLASPQLFIDAQVTGLVSASLKTCGISLSTDTPLPELIATRITKPIERAVYLPSSVAGYERSWLINGKWEEDWTYRGCGQTASVRLQFEADGLGGAHILNETPGKETRGLGKE